MIKKIEIQSVKSKNCDLLFLNQIKKNINNINRFFFLSAKSNCIRGEHAHKKCTQYLIAINGNIKIKLDDGKKTNIKIIKELKNMVEIKPMTWLTVYLKKSQKLLVICNKNYSENEYIRDYKLFKKS